MRAQKMSITELVLQKSHEYTRYFRNAALDAAIKRNFDLQVEASLAQQKQLEATDEISFDQYLSNYFSQGVSSSIVHSRELHLLQNLPDTRVKTAARRISQTHANSASTGNEWLC